MNRAIRVRSRELTLHIDPADMFSAIEQNCETAFLLESAEGPEKMARYSFLGFEPEKRITFKSGRITVGDEEAEPEEPLAQLRKAISSSSRAEGFIGGAVGYFSFEYVKQIEKLGTKTEDTPSFPDFEFGVFNDAIVYDHGRNKLRYIYTGKDRSREIAGFAKDASFEVVKDRVTSKRCSTTKKRFCAMVEKAKEHIEAGDIFQVVLSKRYEIGYKGNLMAFYKKLKALNPSPYTYYLKFGDRKIIGSSPENLIRVEKGNIMSYATLAGTRPRGKTPAEDKKLEKELLSDEKERAEHIMLVDLTRNDIGKIAKTGTVKVPELMHVHKYSHVQHIASLVTAKLAQGKDAIEAFNAIFPAGTVSGAPKIRAIELLRKLEGTSRGPYAGAVGYFSANGNSDFAISIRTLFADKNKAYIQSGSGIVYDSLPEREYEETESKAKALMKAIGCEK